MEKPKLVFDSVDQYIATFPPEVQAILQEVRATIKAAVPEAEERISYQIPTFFLHGNLIHYAAYEKHIGMYPPPSGTQPFVQELLKYKTGKGTMRFPIDKPLPLDLIVELVKFRAAENLAKATEKAKKKKPLSKKQAPPGDLPDGLSQPALRALAGAGIQNLVQVSAHTAVEISKMHGIGPTAIVLLEKALAEKGLSFAAEQQ